MFQTFNQDTGDPLKYNLMPVAKNKSPREQLKVVITFLNLVLIFLLPHSSQSPLRTVQREQKMSMCRNNRVILCRSHSRHVDTSYSSRWPGQEPRHSSIIFKILRLPPYPDKLSRLAPEGQQPAQNMPWNYGRAETCREILTMRHVGHVDR